MKKVRRVEQAVRDAARVTDRQPLGRLHHEDGARRGIGGRAFLADPVGDAEAFDERPDEVVRPAGGIDVHERHDRPGVAGRPANAASCDFASRTFHRLRSGSTLMAYRFRSDRPMAWKTSPKLPLPIGFGQQVRPEDEPRRPRRPGRARLDTA